MRDQDGRHAALARQFDGEIHHRFLRRDVEAGCRFVGDEQLRAAGQGQRDDNALAHAAGQLEWVGMIALARPRNAHLLEALDGLFADLIAVDLGMLQQHVLDLVANLADRVERQTRALEDHRHFAATQIAHVAFRCAADVHAAEGHRAVGDTAGAVENAHHGVGRHRLARPGFADDAEGFALGQRQIDVLNGRDRAAPCREFDGEIAHIEQR